MKLLSCIACAPRVPSAQCDEGVNINVTVPRDANISGSRKIIVSFFFFRSNVQTTTFFLARGKLWCNGEV